MDQRFATSRMTVDLDALARNWKLLRSFAPGAVVAAAVKADGYGLGAEQVVTALHKAGCRHYFAANAGEAIAIRDHAPGAEIFMLAGLNAQNAPLVDQTGLVPVLNCDEEIAIWAEHGRAIGRQPPCALHVDTGLNRLGMRVEDAIAFAGDDARRQSVSLVLVMSHLACADNPQHPMNAMQKARFDDIRHHFPGVRASLANSAAILSDAAYAYDMARPGVALYGGEAVTGTVGPMANVVSLEARILQVKHAGKGETVGYGATAILQRDSRIAIAGAGYADGYFRSGSGSGVPARQIAPGAKGAIDGHVVPVLGRISMDLTAFDVTDVPPQVLERAEWIELFGKTIALDDYAITTGTIGYEVLTRTGPRSERVYLGG
ncbi:MAG: alanine racemase [Nitratireductor sp.]|nr:alanine racemase [Nitratireductor sp.]